jgi:hypothetical protein
MKRHIHFNENDDEVGEVEELTATIGDHDIDGIDVHGEDDDDDDDDDDESFSEWESKEDESEDEDGDDPSALFINIRTHVQASCRFRSDVDMDSFTDLLSHLLVVEEMEASAAKTLIGRVAEYIGWTMHDMNVDQEEAVDQIVNKHPLNVMKYLIVLKGPQFGLKNGTVYNTLLDIGHWAQYLAIHENYAVDKLLAVLKARQRKENKKKKQDINERLSRENLVKNNQWPKKGMPELHQILMKHQPRVDRILKSCANGEVRSDADLRFVNDWVVSILFVINPQGRAQAICKLTVEDGQVLCSHGGQVTSTQFKTRATFGSQAINCNPMTQKYISEYVHAIRPLLLGSTRSEALFLNSKGLQHQDIGVCVTRIFNQISNYHITTTLLRSVFETEASEAVDNGTLTFNDVDSVFRNSGHSSTTAHNHYLKRKAEDTGRQAMAVHAKLYGENIKPPNVRSNVRSGTDCSFVPDDNDYDYADDNQVRQRRRIEWTADEMHDLCAWTTQFEQDRGRGASKDWRACVQAMTDTAVFHELHLTPTALREAWRREEKKRARRNFSDFKPPFGTLKPTLTHH